MVDRGVSERLLPGLICVFGIAAVSFGAWARLSAAPFQTGPVPERIARVAFEDEIVHEDSVDTGGPAQRVALVRVVDFQGQGSENLVEYLATRRAAGLGKCFEDEAPYAVLVRLGRQVEVLEANDDARDCLTAALKAWPWPDEARGLVSIQLETALLL